LTFFWKSYDQDIIHLIFIMKKLYMVAVLTFFLASCGTSEPAFDPSTLNGAPHDKTETSNSGATENTNTGTTNITSTWAMTGTGNTAVNTSTGMTTSTGMSTEDMLAHKDTMATNSGSASTGSTAILPSTSPVLTGDISSLTPVTKAKLRAIANHAIEDATKGTWNKKMDLVVADGSGKAVIGTWWSDTKNWLAWKAEDGAWKLIIDTNGFYCSELLNIPKEYETFFSQVTLTNGVKNCHE
jgi:hypothetical protein